MSKTYSTPEYPNASLITLSHTVEDLDQLLANLPDNNNNLIDPKDLRDTAFTLWNKIETVSASFSIMIGGSTDYDRATPTGISVGGAVVGSTFSGTVQDALDKILYPYLAPIASLTGGNTREFGSSTAVSLNWSVTKKSNSIVSIVVAGISITPTGGDQSGVQAATATQNVNTTLSMSAFDGTNTATSNTIVTWRNKRYWGTSATFGALNNAQILALSGAGVGSGNELSNTLTQTRNGINGNGQFLVFAWPTSFGTPTFMVNGLQNTAYTKVNSALSFTNSFGYVNTYDVWMSNTAQNSPIGTFQIN